MTIGLKSELRKQRELRILSQLDKLGLATVEHLMRLDVGDLGKGGRRNALRVLNEMERDGLVSSWRYGMKIYGVAGKKLGHWEHTLLRNDFLVWKGWFDRCRMEIPIRKNGEIVLRADVGVKLQGSEKWLFIEVDRRSKRSVNSEKIKLYEEMGLDFVVVCYRDRKYMWKGCRHYIVEDWK